MRTSASVGAIRTLRGGHAVAAPGVASAPLGATSERSQVDAFRRLLEDYQAKAAAYARAVLARDPRAAFLQRVMNEAKALLDAAQARANAIPGAPSTPIAATSHRSQVDAVRQLKESYDAADAAYRAAAARADETRRAVEQAKQLLDQALGQAGVR